MTHSAPSRLEQAGNSFIRAIARFVSRPGDTYDEQVQKGLLVGGAMIVLPAAIIWGAAYFYYGETVAGLITYAYLLLSIAGLIYLHRTGKREPLAGIQIASTLFLPFLLTLALGGIVNSSAIILAAIMSPLGILMHSPAYHERRWFAGFILLFFLAALLDPIIRRTNGLPGWLILAIFVLNVSILSAIIFFMTRTYIQQRDLATQQLRREQEKSERLLLNVLPASIAAILKEGNRTIADRFDEVSVLFADVVGSTPLSEELDPVEIVDLLNDIFNYFDTVVLKYDLEKVRTMGDSYMVVSGAPLPRPDHAQTLARAALEMREFHKYVHTAHADRLNFRFGMNCGPVIAGIIGRTKFHYDVWGDTVNVASRMESHGEPGKIQITQRLYDLLQDDFLCQPRGTIDIKGKGPMPTYFLLSAKP
jgi:adenylate cyclase